MRAQKPADHTLSLNDDFFIPDLCQINNVLFLLILTQLLALVLCLVNSENSLINWEVLGLLSIYCHTLALTFSAIICVTRKTIRKRGTRTVIAYFMCVNIAITGLYSWLGSTVFLPGIIQEPELFSLKSVLISSMIACLLLRYFYLQFQWNKQKQAELQARIQALQARIRPHFLFNSMNSIASLIAIDPLKAEDAVLDLSTLFRATLNNQESLIPIEDEIALCRRYLNIESLRLGDRLKVDWQINLSHKKIYIPPLTLQPLFENAIYHGIQPRTEGGTITLQSDCKHDYLYILISNPYDENLEKHQGNHIALDNIRSRLTALFGDDAVLKTSQLNSVFTVTLRFPV